MFITLIIIKVFLKVFNTKVEKLYICIEKIYFIP